MVLELYGLLVDSVTNQINLRTHAAILLTFV